MDDTSIERLRRLITLHGGIAKPSERSTDTTEALRELLAIRERVASAPTSAAKIDILFDGPPGPIAGRFVEVEDMGRKSLRRGEWVHRPDGFCALRIDDPAAIAREREAAAAVLLEVEARTDRWRTMGIAADLKADTAEARVKTLETALSELRYRAADARDELGDEALRDSSQSTELRAALSGAAAIIEADRAAVRAEVVERAGSYCLRYSVHPGSLTAEVGTYSCDCGRADGWSGSFAPPGKDSKWSLGLEQL